MPQRPDALGVVRPHVAHEIDELAVEAAGHAPRQPLRIAVERLGEPREFLRRLRELCGVGPHRVDRRAHRERVAVAVEDHAAVRRQLRDAGEARIALLLEEALVDHLQVDRARDQHARREREQREHEQRRASAAGARVRLPLRSAHHGWTMRRSAARGISILQIVARDPLDAAVRAPGALLELQLPPFDVELVALHREALQLDETRCAPGACRRRRRATSRALRSTARRPRSARRAGSCGDPLGDAQHGAAARADCARSRRPTGVVAPPIFASRGRACGGICGRPA